MSKRSGEWDCRGKRRPRSDLELQYPCTQRPAPGAVERWLQELPLEARVAAMKVDNSWAASMLRQMLGVKLRDGDVVFTPVLTFPAAESADFEHYFVPVRPERLQQAEALALEHHLRFMDNAGYINSLSVSRELASDFPLFSHISATLSGNCFLKYPCYMLWDSGRKQWVCECPQWVIQETFTMSQFALALIEKAIWVHYYQAEKLESRAPGELQIPPVLPSFSPDNLEDLAIYWGILSNSEQSSLASDLKVLISLFDSQQSALNSLEIASQAPCSSVSFLSLFHNPSEHYSALRSQMQHYMVRASVDLIRRASRGNPVDFMEFLLRSPMERAGTMLDRVARAVGVRIRERQAEQVAMELITEEPERQLVGKQHQKKRKYRKKSMHAGKDSEARPVPPAETAESLIKDVLELIVSNAYEQIYTDHEDFHTVQRRKRYEKPVKSPTLSPIKPSNPPPLSKITPISHLQQAVIVIEHSPGSRSLPFQPDLDFPPLSTDLLTKALQVFSASVEELVAGRRPALISIVEKLQGVVSACFPGAFLAIYGSQGTGLALPTSDLDLVILNSGVNQEETGSAVKALEEGVKGCVWVQSAKGLSTASVPVLKLTVEKEIEVDLTFDDMTHGGLAACAWVGDFLRRSPAAVQCLRLLKQLLVAHHLHSAYLGGLCSYSLVLWMAVYCFNRPYTQAGDLLFDFLSFYGLHFDPKSTAISYGLGFVPITHVQAYCETWDPLHTDNNTTKGAYRVAEVLAVFRRAYGYFGRLREAESWRVDRGPLTLLELGKI